MPVRSAAIRSFVAICSTSQLPPFLPNAIIRAFFRRRARPEPYVWLASFIGEGDLPAFGLSATQLRQKNHSQYDGKDRSEQVGEGLRGNDPVISGESAAREQGDGEHHALTADGQ